MACCAHRWNTIYRRSIQGRRYPLVKNHFRKTIKYPLLQQNVHTSVRAGVSEYVHYPTLTTAGLKEKLTKVLTDPGYRKRMAIRSRRLRDQPEKPIDRAVWWIEYVLRNPKCPHFHSPVKELGFISGNSLDLYGILLVIFLAMAAGVGWGGRRLYQFFAKSNRVPKPKSKIN